MMFRQSHEKKSHILYSFSFIVVLSSFVLLLLCLMTLDNFVKDIIGRYSVDELSQISYSTNFMFENARSLLVQYVSNPSVLKLMNYDSLSDRETSELFFSVSQVNVNLFSDHQILIYNKKAGKIYDSTGAYFITEYSDSDLIARLTSSSGLQKLYPYPRTVRASGTGERHQVYTFYLFDGNPSNIESAVVLNMSQDWLKNTIKSMDVSSKDTIIVTDSNGTVVIDNDSYAYLSSIRDDSLFSQAFHSNDGSGCYIQSLLGEKYMVSYVISGSLNWKFIRITPYHEAVQKYQNILFTIAAIVIAVTALSLVITLLFSNRVNLFYNIRIKEMERQYQSASGGPYGKKQAALRKILYSDVGKNQIKGFLLQNDINFNLSESFVIIYFQIDHGRKYCNTYSSADRELFSYGIVNIINEISSSYFSHEAVAVDPNGFALLLNMKIDNYQTTELQIDELIGKIQAQIMKYIDVTASAVTGKILEDFSEIPLCFERCREAIKYTLLLGTEANMSLSKIEGIQKQSYLIPLDKINSLVDSLALGKQDMAENCYSEIMEEVSHCSYTNFQMTVTQISLVIKSFVEKQNVIFTHFDVQVFPGLDNNITDYDSLENLKNDFYIIFEKICISVSNYQPDSMKAQKYENFIGSVNSYIQTSYTDPSLSPDSIAEHFSISSEYLRRLYKKVTHSSLSEFITRFRLERASENLQKTDDSIAKISEQTGFTNLNYFYSIFKKYYQLTPNEYRKIAKTNHP